MKVNLVVKIMQSAYLCVTVHVKHKKLPFLAVLTWFLILGKIQDGGNDGDHCRWRHRPPAAPAPTNIPYLVKKIKGFSLKVKSFQNTATYQKHRGGVPSTPSPPCTTVGVWICVCVLGLNALGCKKKIKLWTNLKKTKHLKEAIDAILCLLGVFTRYFSFCEIKDWS